MISLKVKGKQRGRVFILNIREKRRRDPVVSPQICRAKADADSQLTIFDSSASKKQVPTFQN